MSRTLPLLGALLTLTTPLLSAAQPVERSSPLSVEQIMQEPETWVGDWPENARWHENGQALYFDWNPEGQFPSDSLYKVSRSGGEPQKVSSEERRSHPPTFDGWHHGEHVYTDDFRRKVYAADGDLYLYDRSTDTQTRLTDTRVRESTPRFDLDGERVLFQREDNLFALTLSTGLVRQLTDLRSGSAPEEEDSTAQEQFLKEQQTALFETLKEEKEDQADNPPPTYHYGDQAPHQLQMGPQERFVSFTQETEPPEVEQTVVADYVTLSGFAEVERARPKVGIPPEDFSLYLQDLERDTTYEVNLHQLPGAYDTPKYLQEKGVEQDSSEAKRALYSYGPYWSPDGEHAVLVVRANDNKDRWIVRLNPSTGDLTVLDRQHDDAWIGGPGIGSYGGPGTVGWMPGPESGSRAGSDRFYFQSEATGWSHLYTVNVETGEIEQITSGEFEVSDPHLSRDGSTWTFTSTEKSPHERHVYRMSADGGERTRLTSEAGMY
ncbi:MAG: S9 family peptidase, partial [Bacteroidetes bacterium QH_7_64_110]